MKKNNDDFTLEIRPVKKSEAISSREIIKKINKETGITQEAIQEVLDAFVDIYTVELLTTGAWRYPGMGSVQRYVKKATSRKHPVTKEIVDYPETCYLRSKLSFKLNDSHKKIFKQLNNNKNTMSKDEIIKIYNETSDEEE